MARLRRAVPLWPQETIAVGQGASAFHNRGSTPAGRLSADR